jgi:tRNA dimethylallyltransferase
VIVNADALQVYDGWRILTARPSEEEARAPHALYGHVPFEAEYSVGDWLRAVAPMLRGGPRPIIVGGTGLYFRALTEGLAEIPPIPDEIRAEAEGCPRGHADMAARAMTPHRGADRHAEPRPRASRVGGPARHGPPLVAWQAETGARFCRLSERAILVLDADRDWLNDRIERVSTDAGGRRAGGGARQPAPLGTGRAARARPSARRS